MGHQRLQFLEMLAVERVARDRHHRLPQSITDAVLADLAITVVHVIEEMRDVGHHHQKAHRILIGHAAVSHEVGKGLIVLHGFTRSTGCVALNACTS